MDRVLVSGAILARPMGETDGRDRWLLFGKVLGRTPIAGRSQEWEVFDIVFSNNQQQRRSLSA
jgi:hypothetical protein